MNDNKKKLNEFIDILKWQVDIGADSMVEEKKNNLFLKKEKIDKNQTSEDFFSEVPGNILANDLQAINKNNDQYLKELKNCSTLEMLKDAILKFDGCDLKKTATQIVFADGNPSSDIMFVGEAPGAEEDRQGIPFCGASGQLLDKMLASINLDRKSVYITNVIPWRPPGNRTPTDNEINLMKPFLMKHIEIVMPKILVAIGGSSAKAVLDIKGGILRHRGVWSELELDNGKKISTIPTLHPAYLMRAPNQKKLAWEDLKSIRSRLSLL